MIDTDPFNTQFILSVMKQILSFVLIASALTAAAQPKKAPKMAPVTAPGYYLGKKNDTIRGEVRTNPDDETQFYKNFEFKTATKPKLTVIDTKKTKAYGVDGRHFVAFTNDGEEIYLERIAEGRLNLYKYRFNGKIDGYPAVETTYFAQDTRAEGEDAGLKEIKKISTKFYKKDLKPYMKDQPMIWTDLDKFTFEERAVVNAFNEYNKFYATTAD